MLPFDVTFHSDNEKLIRCVVIGTQTFIEQFDQDGWYGYHFSVFNKITEQEAIGLVLSILQKTNPEYKNEGRARFKLYEFSLLHFGTLQFAIMAADRLGIAVKKLVDNKILDSRSEVADRLLDYASTRFGDRNPIGKLEKKVSEYK